MGPKTDLNLISTGHCRFSVRRVCRQTKIWQITWQNRIRRRRGCFSSIIFILKTLERWRSVPMRESHLTLKEVGCLLKLVWGA